MMPLSSTKQGPALKTAYPAGPVLPDFWDGPGVWNASGLASRRFRENDPRRKSLVSIALVELLSGPLTAPGWRINAIEEVKPGELWCRPAHRRCGVRCGAYRAVAEVAQ